MSCPFVIEIVYAITMLVFITFAATHNNLKAKSLLIASMALSLVSIPIVPLSQLYYGDVYFYYYQHTIVAKQACQLASIFLFICFLVTLSTYNEDGTRNFAGITGWLLLPAIGLIVGPLSGIWHVCLSLLLFLAGEVTMNEGRFLISVFIEACLIWLLIKGAISFFKKERRAPSIIYMYLACLVVALLLLVLIWKDHGSLGYYTSKDCFDEYLLSFIASLISSAIWMPYFGRSKRVKATFVN